MLSLPAISLATAAGLRCSRSPTAGGACDIELTFEFRETGALFDGRAERAAADFCDHIKHKFADDLITLVRAHLLEVIRVNHGVYMSWAHQEIEGDEIVVTDRWIVYGPWLEGVGSKNSPVTRFPGYHSYAIVAQEFNLVATERAYDELPPYLAIMNE